ncbi:MAG: 2,3,4,5-tetrahydropyridine-2,6-dicarboxylate N-succinyltransferase, partial [Dietzia maris]
MSAHGAVATGIATLTSDHTVLDVWYPEPELGAASAGGHRVLSGDEVPAELSPLTGADADRGVETVAVRVEIEDLTQPPADAYDAYLRLHLISHRLTKPHFANMDGLFGKLSNVVWTNFGPCAVPGFELVRAKLRARGPVTV